MRVPSKKTKINKKKTSTTYFFDTHYCLGGQNTMTSHNTHWIQTRHLPNCIKKALKDVGFHKRDICLTISETVNLGCSSGSGYRAYSVILAMDTGKYAITRGSWGGPNAFQTNPNDVDTDVIIPANGIVIMGMEGGIGPVSASLYASPVSIAKILPEKPSISERGREILKLWGYTSAYRKSLLHKSMDEEIESLICKGFLKRTKNGSIRITCQGKNAI
jgi:hypothetical protein